MSATLKMSLVNTFGDSTEVTKTVGEGIEDVYEAIRECLLAFGYSSVTVDEWFPVDEMKRCDE